MGASDTPEEGGGPPAEPDEAAADREEREELEREEVERERRRTMHDLVHLWIPLAIVIVSVLAAVMGWRASVADETATHTEELSRQDLVHQQQLLITANDAVNNDIRTYGQFAQYSGLAHSLLHDAPKIGGKLGDQMFNDGQADLGIALYLGKGIRYLGYGFDPSSPTANSLLRTDGTLLPGKAYNAALGLDVAENVDTELHGLAPDALHRKAESTRLTGVRLTGIAALFVAVMVLLTVAAIATGAAKLWLATSGAVLAVAAIVLFALVELS